MPFMQRHMHDAECHATTKKQHRWQNGLLGASAGQQLWLFLDVLLAPNLGALGRCIASRNNSKCCALEGCSFYKFVWKGIRS